MKTIRLLAVIVLLPIIFFLFSSCNNKNKTNNNETHQTDEVKKETEIANKGDNFETEDTDNQAHNSDVDQAVNCIASYIKAAKKLDFDEMSKYISDSSTLPILDSYRASYSRYNISDNRIKELCIARLGTYKFTVVSSEKSENDVKVQVKIASVNMESLQNRWMEELCNKYPEYTNLTEEQMTSDVVDTLIKTMIEVLNKSESSEIAYKDFIVKNKNGSFIINAKNSDFFTTN